MSTNEHTTEAQAIIAFAEKRTEPHIVMVDIDDSEVAPFHVLIDGQGEAVSLKALVDEQRMRPCRRKGTVHVTTVESFVELVRRDANEDSIIFADDGMKPALVAVLNFHGPGSGDEPHVEFCDDRVSYSFPLSEEWTAWTGANGERAKMDQARFAEFIEDRLFDIGDVDQAGPTAAAWAAKMGVKLAGPQALMAVSRGLTIRVEETFKNIVKRETGETDFVFATAHKDDAGEAVRVPTAFHILIPILRGGSAYSIPVRLRYRVGGGKVAWFFELHRPEVFLRDAVGDAIQVVRAAREDGGCGLPVIMGTPPSSQ